MKDTIKSTINVYDKIITNPVSPLIKQLNE